MRLLVRPFKACKVCFDIFQQPLKMAPWQWDLVEYCSVQCWQKANPKKVATSAIPVPKPPKVAPGEPPPMPTQRPKTEKAVQIVLDRPSRKEPERQKKKRKNIPVNEGTWSARTVLQACIKYAEKHNMPASEAKRLWGLK